MPDDGPDSVYDVAGTGVAENATAAGSVPSPGLAVVEIVPVATPDGVKVKVCAAELPDHVNAVGANVPATVVACGVTVPVYTPPTGVTVNAVEAVPTTDDNGPVSVYDVARTSVAVKATAVGSAPSVGLAVVETAPTPAADGVKVKVCAADVPDQVNDAGANVPATVVVCGVTVPV